jgi:hypothetical protein
MYTRCKGKTSYKCEFSPKPVDASNKIVEKECVSSRLGMRYFMCATLCRKQLTKNASLSRLILIGGQTVCV